MEIKNVQMKQHIFKYPYVKKIIRGILKDAWKKLKCNYKNMGYSYNNIYRKTYNLMFIVKKKIL